jgi:hypothetical protein
VDVQAAADTQVLGEPDEIVLDEQLVRDRKDMALPAAAVFAQAHGVAVGKRRREPDAVDLDPLGRVATGALDPEVLVRNYRRRTVVQPPFGARRCRRLERTVGSGDRDHLGPAGTPRRNGNGGQDPPKAIGLHDLYTFSTRTAHFL